MNEEGGPGASNEWEGLSCSGRRGVRAQWPVCAVQIDSRFVCSFHLNTSRFVFPKKKKNCLPVASGTRAEEEPVRVSAPLADRKFASTHQQTNE